MNRKKESNLLTIIIYLAGMLFIVSGSIAVPILIRPLYAMQIDPLHLTEVKIALAEGTRTLTRAEIMEAYNDMMNYCIGLSSTFRTGILAFSEEGRMHFEDVRKLFLLDLWVLGISGTIVLGWQILRRVVNVRLKRWAGHRTGFWCAVTLLVLFAVIGIFGAIDFTRFFTIFHHVFFPGKSNWIFDPRYDQIINILPEEVFMHFAAVVAGLILLTCIILILRDLKRQKKNP
ncbi:MAG: TIGR01906 family membrane protein [Firmicutes bacterium]|nr:TIGR01906 family membrane protein [Bacillota bacterium]